MPATKKNLGVITWPPAIQAEGVNAVLDNLQEAGVTVVSTSPHVAEPAPKEKSDQREPPENGDKGVHRVIDRPLWGKNSLYLRNGSSFKHDASLFSGMKYTPKPENDLTDKHGHVISDFIAEAHRRGMKVYLQMHVSHLPDLREGLSESERLPDVPRLPDGNPPNERMVQFASLASPAIRDYFAAEVKDVLQAYPEVDGLLLDRAEQSFYMFHDAFVDFGPHAQSLAADLDFDFPAMKSATAALLEEIASWQTEDLMDHVIEGTLPLELGRYMTERRGISETLMFRSAVTTSFLANLRSAADSVRSGVELVPITFPTPLSTVTGADFASYSQHVDATMIKFFTMHWPMIVTYWTEGITSINPSLDPNAVARAVSTAFDLEDELGETLGDYVYPGPDTPHIAGTKAQIKKIKQAQEQAGSMPIFPSVHAYGPMEDVERRWRIGWETGSHGMWLNRYGYLSEQKLALLKRVVSGA